MSSASQTAHPEPTGRDEYKHFGVFKVCVTNGDLRSPEEIRTSSFFRMATSEVMVKQVFVNYRFHLHLAALVRSDLGVVGEGVETIFRLLKDQERLIGDWRHLIAPANAVLPGWTRMGLHKDGWGRDTLYLWQRDPRAGVAPDAPPASPAVAQQQVPASAWACAMMRAVEHPEQDVRFHHHG